VVDTPTRLVEFYSAEHATKTSDILHFPVIWRKHEFYSIGMNRHPKSRTLGADGSATGRGEVERNAILERIFSLPSLSDNRYADSLDNNIHQTCR